MCSTAGKTESFSLVHRHIQKVQVDPFAVMPALDAGIHM